MVQDIAKIFFGIVLVAIGIYTFVNAIRLHRTKDRAEFQRPVVIGASACLLMVLISSLV